MFQNKPHFAGLSIPPAHTDLSHGSDALKFYLENRRAQERLGNSVGTQCRSAKLIVAEINRRRQKSLMQRGTSFFVFDPNPRYQMFKKRTPHKADCMVETRGSRLGVLSGSHWLRHSAATLANHLPCAPEQTQRPTTRNCE